MSEKSGRTADESTESHTAGAFDIRSLIALLVVVYGVVLVVMGIVNHSDSDLAKSDGINVNLWTGLGMIVVAVLMQTWAMLRPVIVPADVEKDDEGPPRH